MNYQSAQHRHGSSVRTTGRHPERMLVLVVHAFTEHVMFPQVNLSYKLLFGGLSLYHRNISIKLFWSSTLHEYNQEDKTFFLSKHHLKKTLLQKQLHVYLNEALGSGREFIKLSAKLRPSKANTKGYLDLT